MPLLDEDAEEPLVLEDEPLEPPGLVSCQARLSAWVASWAALRLLMS